MAELSTRQKAAAVLMCVDPETAAAVLKNLSEGEIAAVTREMHTLGQIDPAAATAVLHEFTIRAGQSQPVTSTPEGLRRRLELAVGADGARSMLRDLGVADPSAEAFRTLQSLPPDHLGKVLADEHPQTIAIVLANLEPRQTSAVLAQFQPELQTDVIGRMARSQPADENMLKRVDDLVRAKSSLFGQVRKTPDDPRYKKVAEVINLLGPTAEESILKTLSSDSPDMVKRLREMMFVFEDIVNLSNADMRKLIMSIDTQMLAMALKTASEPLKEKVFANLSRRAAQTLTEELELIGPKPLSQVRAAQQQIVDTVRKMNAAGEIKIRASKGEEDPLV